jgi:hypothetical protein
MPYCVVLRRLHRNVASFYSHSRQTSVVMSVNCKQLVLLWHKIMDDSAWLNDRKSQQYSAWLRDRQFQQYSAWLRDRKFQQYSKSGILLLLIRRVRLHPRHVVTGSQFQGDKATEFDRLISLMASYAMRNFISIPHTPYTVIRRFWVFCSNHRVRHAKSHVRENLPKVPSNVVIYQSYDQSANFPFSLLFPYQEGMA